LHPLAQRINNIHGTIFPDPNVMCEPKLPIVVAIATKPGNELHVGIHDGNSRVVRRRLWLISAVRD
jgi:hypothetical protein